MNAYAIVVATRNRADVLATSLKLFLSQTVPPAEIVVVDASDDHAEVGALVAALCSETGSTVPLRLLRADEGNLAAQRNQGLAAISVPIVMYPDDDSYWYPDTAAEILRIYAADSNEVVGGVTGIEVAASPLAVAEGPQRRRRLTNIPRVRWWRHRLETMLFSAPFSIYGAAHTAALAEACGTDHTFKLVETMGGYRMSFRAEALRRAGGFDPALGRHVGYAQHEDKDMCLRMLESGRLLAVAPGARIFHNVHPAPRTRGGFEYGFCQILNYAYITCKVTRPDDPASAALGRYCRYKAWAYGLRRLRSTYLADVARGARAALPEIAALREVPSEALTATYLDAMDRHLGPPR